MKWILLVIFSSLFNWSFSQTTLIPDANFEQKLIELGLDNVLDGSVLTANVNSINILNVNFSNISDLTGIEGFTSLDTLSCSHNQISSLDLSQNTELTYLICEFNNMTSLNVTQNIALTKLFCEYNSLPTLDVTQNINLQKLYCYVNQLTTLDLSQNISLTQLSVYANQLIGLDLTNNVALTDFGCMNNQLQCLNIKNGANNNIVSFSVIGNPNLTCIEVDDVAWATSNWITYIDNTSSFNIDCPNSCSLGLNESSDIERSLLKIVDLFGNEITESSNKLLIYIYSDGTREKIYKVD